MKQLVLTIAVIYGASSVILGAFGAHALKKVMTVEALNSFETGVKYQMYHALVMLIIGFILPFQSKIENWMGWSFIAGTFLFSVSIYVLSIASISNTNVRILGPITPLGGLLMIVGWILLGVTVFKLKL